MLLRGILSVSRATCERHKSPAETIKLQSHRLAHQWGKRGEAEDELVLPSCSSPSNSASYPL